MSALTSLAMLRFGFHGGSGFAFLLVLIVAVLLFLALTRVGRNSA